MADDVDAPNEARWGFEVEYATCYELCFKIAERIGAELPQIAGGQATWTAHSGSPFPFAVIAQQWNWKEPRLSMFLDEQDESMLRYENGTLHLHAVYHAQVDPEVLQQIVRNFCSARTP